MFQFYNQSKLLTLFTCHKDIVKTINATFNLFLSIYLIYVRKWVLIQIHLRLFIQGGREISAILLTVVGDGCKDKKCIQYTIWGQNLIVFSEKGVSCSVLITSYCLYR